MLEDKKTKTKFNVLAIIVIVLFCFALSPVTLQNDTYYTLKIGELITQNGIDMQDHFSWHEDLAYTYPHWAYDTGLYLIYHLGEISGINDGGMLFVYLSTVILACALGILMYYTCKKVTKNQLISFLFTLLAMHLLKDFIAARAQLFTFILFVLSVLFIENFLATKKKRYLIFIVLISIIIANVHVAVWPFFFVIFLPYIAEYIIASILDFNVISKILVWNKKQAIKRIEKKISKAKDDEIVKILNQKLEEANKKLELQIEKAEKLKEKTIEKREKPYKIKIEKNKAAKWLILVMIICAFTGLLTPLGDTPYTYLVKTMQGNTTNSISEHQPLTLYNNKDLMIAVSLVLAVLIFTDTKIKLRDLFMLGGLLYLTFMSRRQMSMFVLIGVFIFAKFIDYLMEKYDKGGCDKFIKLMTSLLGKTLTIAITVLVCVIIWKPKVDDKFIDSAKYPVEASSWMLENLDVENIRIYNEYNYGSYLLFRGIPVFIDSRADLYAPEFNKTKDSEGRDIFSDYINISSIGTYYETKFEKYDITNVITYNNSKLNMFISRNDDYKQLYKDDHFVIYERNVD